MSRGSQEQHSDLGLWLEVGTGEEGLVEGEESIRKGKDNTLAVLLRFGPNSSYLILILVQYQEPSEYFYTIFFLTCHLRHSCLAI